MRKAPVSQHSTQHINGAGHMPRCMYLHAKSNATEEGLEFAHRPLSGYVTETHLKTPACNKSGEVYQPKRRRRHLNPMPTPEQLTMRSCEGVFGASTSPTTYKPAHQLNVISQVVRII